MKKPALRSLFLGGLMGMSLSVRADLLEDALQKLTQAPPRLPPGFIRQITPLTPVKSAPLASGEKWQWHGLSPLPIKGQTTLAVSRVRGNRPVETLSLRFGIETQGPLPIALKPLQRGALLQREDLTLETRPLEVSPEELLTLWEDKSPRVARRPLSRGEVVLSRDVTLPADVTRGAPVDIVLAEGALRVTARGTALADGRLGDRISVRTLDTGKTLNALVCRPGVVEVQP